MGNIRKYALAGLAGLLLTVGCSQGDKGSDAVHPMGDRVQIGPLIYTVLEADWMNQLGSGANVRTPKHRFLVMRLAIENVGNKEITLPLLSVLNGKKEETLELDNGEGVEEWLGLLRQLTPSNTVNGKIAFDVPSGEYSLRLTNGADPENEKFSYVGIPLKLATP